MLVLMLLLIWDRRHQSESVMDPGRALLNHWYPIILQLHRFMVAVSGVAVNHDGRREQEEAT